MESGRNPRGNLHGQRVVEQRDGSSSPHVADALAALGAEVVDVPVYRWEPPVDASPAVRLLEAATARRLHAVTFTCAYALGSAADLLWTVPGNVVGGGVVIGLGYAWMAKVRPPVVAATASEPAPVVTPAPDVLTPAPA